MEKENDANLRQALRQATQVGERKLLSAGANLDIRSKEEAAFRSEQQSKTQAQALSQTYRLERANYWGNGLEILRNQTDPQQCAAMCVQRSDCKVASFHDSTAEQPWTNKCVLRYAVGPRHTEQPGIVSWVKP